MGFVQSIMSFSHHVNSSPHSPNYPVDLLSVGSRPENLPHTMSSRRRRGDDVVAGIAVEFVTAALVEVVLESTWTSFFKSKQGLDYVMAR